MFKIAEEEEEEENCATSPIRSRGDARPSRAQPAQLRVQPVEPQALNVLQPTAARILSAQQVNAQDTQVEPASATAAALGEKDDNAEVARPSATEGAAVDGELPDIANMPLANPSLAVTNAAMAVAGVCAAEMVQAAGAEEAATADVSAGAGPSAPAPKTMRSGRQTK